MPSVPCVACSPAVCSPPSFLGHYRPRPSCLTLYICYCGCSLMVFLSLFFPPPSLCAVPHPPFLTPAPTWPMSMYCRGVRGPVHCGCVSLGAPSTSVGRLHPPRWGLCGDVAAHTSAGCCCCCCRCCSLSVAVLWLLLWCPLPSSRGLPHHPPPPPKDCGVLSRVWGGCRGVPVEGSHDGHVKG